MADFTVFLPSLLKLEGGFADNPSDPGGATNKGVTLETFRGCAQILLGIEPTLDNLRDLTDTQAGVIYKVLYWDKAQGDNIASQKLANMVCDFYVNAGRRATKLLQTVLNGMGARLAVDGVLGPASLEALASAAHDEVCRRYTQGRIDYYHGLVEERPGLIVFLDGWVNRVNSLAS